MKTRTENWLSDRIRRMPDFVQQLLQRAQASSVRGTAVSPLAWLLGTLLSGLAASQAAGAPAWLIIVLGILCVIVVVWFLGAYTYFACTDRDCLRSERYTLTKLAIEHSIKGDNISGLIGELTDSPRLPPPKPEEDQ